MSHAVMQLAPTGQWSRTGLALPQGLLFDDWLAVGEQLRDMEQSIMWWVGDWLLYGEQSYAERFAKAAELTGYTVEHLKLARTVSAAFPTDDRREAVSWSHYKIAAKLPKERRLTFIKDAETNRWTCQDLRYAIAKASIGTTEENAPALPMAHTASRHAKFINKLVADAFADWFGLGEEYSRVVLGLYQAGGKPQGWRDLARFVSTHQPMTRGALHEAISSLREAFECEAIDRDDDGYWLTEVGLGECRRAFRELGQQLIGMGQEPANDAFAPH